MELNGKPVTRRELQALALVNYGHFTTMRVDKRRVRGLALHLERLARDCHVVFDAELDIDRVRCHIRSAVKEHPGPVTLRVTVFDPEFDITRTGADATPQVLVTLRPAPNASLPPLRVRSCPSTRDLPKVKHIGLFNTLHHRRRAQRAGFDDILMVGKDRTISEGSTWNVGFINDGRVFWPDTDVLRGVTMTLLQRHIPHHIIPIGLHELTKFEAAFATNTSAGIRTISAVDDVPFSTGNAVLNELHKTYESIPGDAL